MNILFCIGSMSKGGAERVISNIIKEIYDENKISIIATKINKIEYQIPKNVQIYSLDNNEENKNFILKNIKRITRLKKYIKTIKPDIIISFLPEPSYRVLLLKKILNIPVIVSVRNDPKIEYKSKLNNIIMKILYPMADGFVFQTEEAKAYFSKKIQDKSIIIPNPINEEFIAVPYKGEREKNIVTVGRLEKQKNQEILIKAFSKLPDDLKEYKLIIYGDGSLRDKLQKDIEDLNLSQRVILAGKVDNVKEKIYKSSLFVLSSDYEGMPNALMEAMALGIPCIATDCPCGGPRYLIKNDQNGILVPVNDANKLSLQMKRILEDNELSNIISENANKISETLNNKNIAKIWIEYIGKVRNN